MNQLPGQLHKLEQEHGVLLAEVTVRITTPAHTSSSVQAQAQPALTADAAPLADRDAGTAHFSALLLHAGAPLPWHAGAAVTLSFKETEVALAKNLRGDISLRNRQPALITGIGHGKLLTAVQLQFGMHALTAVITTGSAHRLQLQVGDAVEWLVKANEMHVQLTEPTP